MLAGLASGRIHKLTHDEAPGLEKLQPKCDLLRSARIDKLGAPRVQTPTMSVTFRLSTGLLAAVCALSLSGCNINKIVADGTGDLLEEGAPALDAYWDYDIAGIGIASAIIQLETFRSVSPDNEKLAMNLAKAYVGYTQGWVEGQYETAFMTGDFDKADRLRARARHLYLRARNLALHAMRVRDEGIDEAIKSVDQTALPKYLVENYVAKEDAGPIFWTGLAWGAAINMSLDQPDLIADLPIIKPFIERARDLDDLYFNGAAYVALGTIEASFPPALGGDPEKGKEWFERGLERTERKNNLLQVMYARIYAVNTRNQALFFKLLNEVIEAPDAGDAYRLANKVARVRAERYLTHAKDLF
jgi:hypothetical protein